MVDHPLSGLRSARIEAGVEPQILAERIGVHINSYYRFESGQRRLYFDKAVVLADALGVSLDRLRRDPVHGRPRRPGPVGDSTVVAQLAGWEEPS
jgi:transcriptional regulator with XRE-family HTH domain